MGQRVSEGNRLIKGLSPRVAASIRRSIAWLDQEIAQLEAEYRELRSNHPALSAQVKLYRSIPGIGPLTAATLVAELPELGYCDGRILTSLSGLAPWARDSGRRRGRRSIRAVAASGASQHPGRTGHGAADAVHGGAVGGAASSRPAALLPGLVPAGQGQEGGTGGGNAEAAAASERRGSTWRALDIRIRPCRLKPLDIQHRYSCLRQNSVPKRPTFRDPRALLRPKAAPSPPTIPQIPAKNPPVQTPQHPMSPGVR